MSLYQPGFIIRGRFRLDHILGEGGFAVTWRGLDLETGEFVAVKILSLRAVEQWRAVELFEREAKVLKNLEHPNIPRYIDFVPPSDETGHDAFVLVQALAEGTSLGARIKDGWRPTEEDARGVAHAVLDTLVYLHNLSPPVIHRDIKPQNVIIGDNGRVMLVDFGSVRDTLTEASGAGSVAGTFGYMAPEQFAGRTSPASDLYGLGATLVHLLSHKTPAELPMSGLHLDFRSAIHVSDSFADFLERILEPSPLDRPQSAVAARALLQRVGSETQLAPASAVSSVFSQGEPTLPWEGAHASLVLDMGEAVLRARKAGSSSSDAFAAVFFTLIWFAIIGTITWLAVAVIGATDFVLYTIPFWLAGIALLAKIVMALPIQTILSASRLEVSVERRLGSFTLSRKTWGLDQVLSFGSGPEGGLEMYEEELTHRIPGSFGGMEVGEAVYLLNRELETLKAGGGPLVSESEI